MPTRAVFHCQFCDAVPDHGTQRSLAGQVSERMFGEYLDAFPGRWLVWNGGGPLGPRRYACREHRGDLVAYLRYHYATVAAQVWKMPPYQARWPDEKRPHMGGSMGIIKFGLRGGLLQDRPSGGPHGEPAATGAPAQADAPGGPKQTPAQADAPGGPTQTPAPDPVAPPPDAGPPAPGSAAPTATTGDRDSERDPHRDTPPHGSRGPGAEPPATADAAAPSSDDPFPKAPDDPIPKAPDDPFPKAADDPFGADEQLGSDTWDPSEGGLFPPGELFLPTDGLFAPGGGAGWGEDSEDDDPPWPRLDGSAEDDDGPWPTGPGSPPA